MTDTAKSPFERRVFGTGSILFKEGADGDEAFLIESGKVEIAMRGRNERRVALGVLGRGELVGEMALISGGPRIASAVALTDVSVIVIPRSDFEGRIAAMDPVMSRVLQTLTRKLQVLSEQHVDEVVKIR
ncbi:cyclic nucleotide-binding domain-containing protein [Pacificispira sp.]|uniref:cyclic nucleotide-binding domain-containing protein n=1 Tax=Pacificispira sp. TaxID=2888761 RepID=UPI003BACEC88